MTWRESVDVWRIGVSVYAVNEMDQMVGALEGGDGGCNMESCREQKGDGIHARGGYKWYQ